MATRHPLPYGFAKAHNLLLEDTGDERVLWAAVPADAAATGPTFSALSEVLPEWVDLAEVVVRPGVRYIDPSDYEAFILEVFKASAVVRDTPSAGTWEIEGPERARLA